MSRGDDAASSSSSPSSSVSASASTWASTLGSSLGSSRRRIDGAGTEARLERPPPPAAGRPLKGPPVRRGRQRCGSRWAAAEDSARRERLAARAQERAFRRGVHRRRLLRKRFKPSRGDASAGGCGGGVGGGGGGGSASAAGAASGHGAPERGARRRRARARVGSAASPAVCAGPLAPVWK